MKGLALTLLFVLGSSSEKVIFNDEFDTLDVTVWKHEITLAGGGNFEFQYYHNNRSTSYVKDGVLFIKPGLMSDYLGIDGDAKVRSGYTLDVWGGMIGSADQCTSNSYDGCSRTSGDGGTYLNPTTSARLRTAEHFSFKYGRVEVRAKMPKGDWLWPAIWMLPRHDVYGNWPASGEIDICETRGNVNYPKGKGLETFGSTLHYGPAPWFADGWAKTTAVHSLPSGTLNDQFHTYGLVWSQDRIYTYFDDQRNIVLDVKIDQDFWRRGQFPPPYESPWQGRPINAPFDQEFYLILNLAVGGRTGFFPDGVGGKPWNNMDLHAMNAFYNATEQWYPSWGAGSGDSCAMQIYSVKVWSLDSTGAGARSGLFPPLCAALFIALYYIA